MLRAWASLGRAARHTASQPTLGTSTAAALTTVGMPRRHISFAEKPEVYDPVPSWHDKRHSWDMMSWRVYDEGEELQEIRVELRKTGTTSAEALRKQRRTPIMINAHKKKHEVLPAISVAGSIPYKVAYDLLYSGRLYNQVLNFTFDDATGLPPIKAVTSIYNRKMAPDRPDSIVFSQWHPNKRYKIKVPCHFMNREDCLSIKKGAMLRKLDDYVPFYWKSESDKIPKGIIIDLLHAKPPATFKMEHRIIPEGLKPLYPNHSYSLATLKGTRKYYNTQDAEDDAPTTTAKA